MVFHWSLSDSRFPQLSRILTDLNNAVVWMVSIRPSISNSSRPLSKHTNYNWYRSFLFLFSGKIQELVPLFVFFDFHSVVRRDSKVHYMASSHFLLIIIRLLFLYKFFTPALVDSFSLEYERQQVSRALLSILADLNNVVVWMVSTCPLISMSSSHFINPLLTVLRAPITIGINITFMFHRFFNSLSRSRLLLL